MDDGKVTITIEIDAELLAQVTEVLKSYEAWLKERENNSQKHSKRK